MAVATPVSAWVASIMAATGVAQSSSLTVTVNITAGWEVQVPIWVQVSAVSADPVVEIYPTMDGGAAYDTVPLTSFTLPRVSGGGVTQSSIRLSTGQYAIRLLASGSGSQSFAVLTQMVITAINNA